ncbi:MAG: ABC transporter permease [Verrucomicrobia bacterium]|nr:ABC transporter permease [Verrucomicrobiota bacterium]
MIERVLALIYKEFLAVWRDKKSRMVLIVPPLLQLFVFAFAATLDVKNVSMGILNRDNGEQAIELIERFKGAKVFSHLEMLSAVEEIAPLIDTQKVTIVLSIDEQFSRNLDAEGQASVQLILDGRKSNAAQIIGGYASTILEQFNRDFAAHVEFVPQNTELVPRNWYNPNLLYPWFTVPNLSGVLMMLVALLLTALSVARERELGTFDQLLVCPFSAFEILVGKAIPALIIGFIEGNVILFAAVFFFGIPFEGFLPFLYFGMFLFLLAVVGIGLFISSLCSTQQQAVLGTFAFMSPAVMLSGFATPIANMPYWLQIVTFVNPLRYYLVIVKGIMLKSIPFSIIWIQMWPLAMIALFNLVATTWFFRHRLG